MYGAALDSRNSRECSYYPIVSGAVIRMSTMAQVQGALGIFGATKVPSILERWAQKLGITVGNSERAVNALFGVLAELFDTRLRIVTCDGSRKTHLVIPTSMKRCRLAKQHSVNIHVTHTASGRVRNSENAYWLWFIFMYLWREQRMSWFCWNIF